MPTTWKLFKIDCVSADESNRSSSSYRKRRQDQLLLWKENNFARNFNNNLPTTEKNEVVVYSNKQNEDNKTHKQAHEEPKIKKSFTKYSTSEKRKTETSKKDKHSDKGKKLHRTKTSPQSSRVQKAKEKFDRDNKKFLEKAIKQYNEKEKDIHLDIPNLQSAIKMSIDSLTFPTELLKKLRDQNGSGRNGKLCNLEAGWLPKPESNHIPEDYEHHILPRHIKQPKTINQRQEERKRAMRKIAEDKGLDPVTNQPLPYLFA